ncbi:MAG: phosphate ABC transporter substrate-binding protein PstS [Pelomonas sp.]|nr:phosphate ABC transporter substrate-binding protein PstS [Roseateles sp.]
MSRHSNWQRFAAAALSAACFAASAQTISGAGSSAAAPVYKIWATEYAKDHGEPLTYEPIGSGAGMARIEAGSVDFGASDVIASKADMAKHDLVMFPTVITGVAPVVNLAHLGPNQLHLSGEVLARIFLGEITQWDAPEIRALNPNLMLPARPIVLVVRADGSGTTYHFADYLGRKSPAWKQRYGAATKLAWPATATAVTGSGGVSKAVRATEGAIGYIDYNYVVDDGLNAISMRNADGQFVNINADGFREAVLHSTWFATGDFASEINDMPGAKSWPITMGTYIAVPRVAQHAAQVEHALRFVTWGYLHGDLLARQAKFVPLPDKVQASAYNEISRVMGPDGKSLGAAALADLVKAR